jgi:rhamnose utilization protein RhaD (predicted bifunctional aldolase and dehydrogenase)
MSTTGCVFTKRPVVAFNSYMTYGTPGIGGKRHVAIVTGPTIFALIKRGHGEIIIAFGNPGFHLEQIIMATVALQPLIKVIFMLENHGFYRFGKDDGATTIVIVLSKGLPAKDEHNQGQCQYGPQLKNADLAAIHICQPHL